MRHTFAMWFTAYYLNLRGLADGVAKTADMYSVQIPGMWGICPTPLFKNSDT